MDNIVLISITQDQLKEIIKQSVAEELNKKQEKQLLNFKETCKLLGVSASALNKWKSENRIPFKKLGKRIFFDRAEIMSSLKEAGLYYKHKYLRTSNE